MSQEQLESLRFPIGKFIRKDSYNAEEIKANIATIRNLPNLLSEAVSMLDDAQLNTSYRENGWTIRQVVHHLADSHLNSVIRLRLALTEDNPTIKPYDENTWAELIDANNAPIELSLAILDGLHERWALLLESLTKEQFLRTFNHPESGRWTVEDNLAMYAWHSSHHLSHITSAIGRGGW